MDNINSQLILYLHWSPEFNPLFQDPSPLFVLFSVFHVSGNVWRCSFTQILIAGLTLHSMMQITQLWAFPRVWQNKWTCLLASLTTCTYFTVLPFSDLGYKCLQQPLLFNSNILVPKRERETNKQKAELNLSTTSWLAKQQTEGSQSEGVYSIGGSSSTVCDGDAAALGWFFSPWLIKEMEYKAL